MVVDPKRATGETRPERLATLYEISKAINSSLDLDVVMDTVMDKVIEVTGASRGFLMLRDDDGALRATVARGLNKEDLDDPDFQYSTTIVNQVVETREPLLTNNAEHDPRFKAGHSIVTMGLRSILCVPMLVKDRLVGVVYVDNSLRSIFQPEDLALLTAFAATASIAIDNARLHQVEVENARREKELSMAHDLQRSLLPRRLQTLPGYEICAIWQSAREVAGDFYDVVRLGEDRVGVAIADVSDKGVSAALFMAAARSLLRSNALITPSPVDTLHQTNHLLIEDSGESGMFVTAYYTVLEPGGRATGVNAGHNLPMLYRRRTGQVEWLPKGGWALGWFEDMPLQPCDIQLEPGDVMVFYTDGLTEAEDERGQFFGDDRLADAVCSAGGMSAQTVQERVVGAVKDFVGDAPPFDDLTLVVVRYTGV